MNAMIYEAEHAFLTKRLDTIDRMLAWFDAKGRRFTRTARAAAQIEMPVAFHQPNRRDQRWCASECVA